MKRIAWCAVFVFSLTMLGAQQTSAPGKYALVIGNGAYTTVRPRLNNPANDANDMKAALESLDWTVEAVINGNLEQMEAAAGRLKARLSADRNSYGLFFYAGHGVQSNGENYLIPVDANIPSENYLRNRTMSVQTMLDDLNDAGNELNILVLDACRDNPFGWNRGGSRGLSLIGRQPADSIIVYATSAGSVANDGTGRNGLFTTHLLNNLKTPGITVRDLFDKTGADVSQASDRKQIPAIYAQYFSAAYLGSPPQPAPGPAPGSAPAVVVPPAAPPEQRQVSPGMVFVEGGTFPMGRDDGRSNEQPVHRVTVGGFHMGMYEVTQKEWTAVMGTNPSDWKGDTLPVENVSWLEAVEFCNKLSVKEGLTPCYRGSGNAITCDWNANGYRLPTEAEWEFAARGGTRDFITYDYSGGNNVDAVGWYNRNSGGKTHPVGTKAPNSLGLYDMSGNVGEWCWDWRGNYAGGTQVDPRGPAGGTTRVVRGGAWNYGNYDLRSADRGIITLSDRSNFIGFRVVRS
jgi:formylglycine-generating enzyme required for sulfatase activity